LPPFARGGLDRIFDRDGDLPKIHSQDLQRGHKKNQFPPTWQILGLILIANKEWCQEMLDFFELKSVSLSTTLLSFPDVQ